MAAPKESKKKIDWGDGHEVVVRKPNLKIIPGDSLICPMPCYPVGEDGEEWKKHEQATSKRPMRKTPR